MELISEAIIFAVKAHDGMRRKEGDVPYIMHPMEAASIVAAMTDDQELLAAAALHDVVEDAGITLDEIEAKFGSRVRALVASETEDKRYNLPSEETWRIRKEESLEVLAASDDEAVLIVWLGDKLANMRAVYRAYRVEGNALWDKFNQKDPAAQGWYYKTIVKLTEKLAGHLAWQEFKRLTDIVFDGVEV